MKISKILLSVAVAFSFGNADALSDLQNIKSNSKFFNNVIKEIIAKQKEIVELEKQNNSKLPYAKRDIRIMIDNAIDKSLAISDNAGYKASVEAYNIIMGFNNDGDRISYHKKNIDMLEQLKSQNNSNNEFINFIQETEKDMIVILEENNPEIDISRASTLSTKMIYESLEASLQEAVTKKDYKSFSGLIPLYKIYHGIDINPNDFLDSMIENKDIEFFKILKENGCDSAVINNGKSYTLLNYLKENDANQEIIKMFE